LKLTYTLLRTRLILCFQFKAPGLLSILPQQGLSPAIPSLRCEIYVLFPFTAFKYKVDVCYFIPCINKCQLKIAKMSKLLGVMFNTFTPNLNIIILFCQFMELCCCEFDKILRIQNYLNPAHSPAYPDFIITLSRCVDKCRVLFLHSDR